MHVPTPKPTTPLARPALVTMALTSAVANAAAAAAAAGAGKKAAQVQLQAELNTDDEWNKFVGRDGLLVVDVYTEWCGPCIGMVGNLKKIKVELGGDNLHLAVAKADTITCLKSFRNRSEPTWMFLAGGQLLNVVFGANAPLITRTIEQELTNELRARKGELQRPQRAPHELTPQEQEIANAQEKLAQERREKEAAAAAATRLARREARAKRLEVHFNDICPGLVLPHAQKHLRKITDALEIYGLSIADKCPIVLGKDSVKMLAMEEPELGTEATVAALVERPAFALMLKRLPDKEGDIIKLCRLALFGESLEQGDGEPPKKVAADELKLGNVPGLYVPSDRHQRAAILDLLFPKMVGTLVPPPCTPEPPHIAIMFGAWQRRAVLGAAKGLLKYGFFANEDMSEPRLLCKTADQYEARIEKDYGETIVLAVAVGVAEPALADPNEPIPQGPPEGLLQLGPLHVSEDAVKGEEECARFFPPGYNEPEHKPKQKTKKKKKKRHETKEEPSETSCDAGAAEEGVEAGEGEGDGSGEGDEAARGDSDEAPDTNEDHAHADKATSPPPAQVT